MRSADFFKSSSKAMLLRLEWPPFQRQGRAIGSALGDVDVPPPAGT
jgi:hypothetical protein